MKVKNECSSGATTLRQVANESVTCVLPLLSHPLHDSTCWKLTQLKSEGDDACLWPVEGLSGQDGQGFSGWNLGHCQPACPPTGWSHSVRWWGRQGGVKGGDTRRREGRASNRGSQVPRTVRSSAASKWTFLSGGQVSQQYWSLVSSTIVDIVKALISISITYSCVHSTL